MNLIEKIKAIEIYVCENFEELGLDDPVEEEYFSAYEEIKALRTRSFKPLRKTMEFLCLKTGKSFTAIRTAAVFSACCPAYWEKESMHFPSCL